MVDMPLSSSPPPVSPHCPKSGAAVHQIDSPTPTRCRLSQPCFLAHGVSLSFTTVVADAGRNYSPALIANYVYDLAKEYNQFYHDCSILKEMDEPLRCFRLLLSATVADVICRGMSLLGIEMPQRM